MEQKLFVLTVDQDPDLKEECASSRKELDSLLADGWMVVQATPVLGQGKYIYNSITNSIVYILEK